MRTNLTLAIEEDLLLEARVIAAKQKTTVNELVRDFLGELVGSEQQRLAAWEQIRTLVERPKARFGGRLPSRDEIHER